MRRLVARSRAGRVAAALLLVGAALPVDATVHELAFRHVVSHEVRLLANGVTQLGSAAGAAGLLGVLALVGRRTGDAALVRAGAGGLVGVALGTLGVQGVKQVACRARPGLLDGWGVEGSPADSRAAARAPWSFFHWPCLRDARYHSFPSGHAVAAFVVAAALTRVAPGRRRLWLGVAGGIGASRILLNAHFLSDVLAGAWLGWWAGASGQRLVQAVGPRLRLGGPRSAAVGSRTRTRWASAGHGDGP